MAQQLPTLEATTAALTDRSRRTRASAIRSVPGLDAPGLYLWWVDQDGASSLSVGLAAPLKAGPIYGGQAGAVTERRTSDATLRSRIVGNHVRGNVYGSTFRFTLASLLLDELDLEPLGGRRMSKPSEARLSTWTLEHLSVTTIAYPDRGRLDGFETEVLARLDPPLNLSKMSPSPLRARLSALRSAFTVGSSVPATTADKRQPTRHATVVARPVGGLTPDELAADLEMSDGKQVRRFLRTEFPRDPADRNTRWGPLPPDVEMSVRRRFANR